MKEQGSFNFRLISLLARWVARVERFLMCAETLGLGNAIKIYCSRFGGSKVHTFNLRGNIPFAYRSDDWGSLTHFFLPGSVFFDAPSAGGMARIIDAGANVGAESVRFLLLYPEAQLVAIELESENFSLLQSNTSWARGRVQCINGAFWYESTAGLTVQDSGAGVQSFQAHSDQLPSRQTVRGYSLGEIMAMKQWDEVDLLKVDVEGAEKLIFERIEREWLSKVRCLIIEPHDSLTPGSLQATFNALRLHSFRSYIVGENIVSIRNDLDWAWRKDVRI